MPVSRKYFQTITTPILLTFLAVGSPATRAQLASPTNKLLAGLGTYATAAQFQSPQISTATQTLQPDLSKNRGNFSFVRGEWQVVNNTLQQTSADTGTRAVIPVDASDYSISVKAKKLSGKEGFLVIFRLKDARNYAWFNVGGWGNTKAQVEVTYNATRTAVGPSAPFTVETQVCRTDISPPKPRNSAFRHLQCSGRDATRLIRSYRLNWRSNAKAAERVKNPAP